MEGELLAALHDVNRGTEILSSVVIHVRRVRFLIRSPRESQVAARGIKNDGLITPVIFYDLHTF